MMAAWGSTLVVVGGPPLLPGSIATRSVGSFTNHS